MIPVWILILCLLLVSLAVALMWRTQQRLRRQIAKDSESINQLTSKLQHTEQQTSLWRETFDGMQDAVIWITKNNKIKHINQTACSLYGYSYEEFFDIQLTDLEPDSADYPAIFRNNLWEECQNHENWVVETVHRRKNGKSFWAEVSIIKFPNQTNLCAIVRNISRRKRRQFSEIGVLERLNTIERRRKQNEQNLRAIIESTKHEIFTMDNQQRLIIANTSFLNRIKSRSGISLQTGDSILKFLPENIKNQLRSSDTITSGIQEEIIHTEADQKIYREITVNSITDSDGYVSGTAFFIRDITSRKQANEELQNRKNQLQNLMKNLSGMVYRFANDENHTALFISGGSQALMGITPDEFIDRQTSLDCFIIAEYRDKIRKRLRRAFKREKPFETEYAILINGEKRWFLEKARPIQQANGNLVLEGLIMDITQRVEAEEKLRENEQFLRNYMLYTPATMFIKDLVGEYLQVNPEFCKMLNLTEVEVLESTDYDLYDTSIADLITTNDIAVLTSETAQIFEETIQLEDQSERILWTAKFPLKDANQQIYALGGVGFDITERKEAEKELLQLKQNLEEAVIQKTQELQTSNDKLKILLIDYQKKTEELHTQEEELLQNMEQLNRSNLALAEKQEEIKIANERFQILHSGANEGLWDWYIPDDKQLKDGSLIWVSEQYRKLLLGKKYSQNTNYQEYNAITWEQNIHPDDRELMRNALHQHLEDTSGKTPYQVEFRVKVDDEYHWFRESCTTIRKLDGQPIRSVGSLQDITEEKLLKSEIDNLLMRYNLAFQSTQEGIWDIQISKNQEIELEKTWISPQLRKLWQLNTEESWMTVWQKQSKSTLFDDLLKFIQLQNQSTQALQKDFQKDYQITLPDQSKRWFRAVGSAVLSTSNNQFLRIAGIISDITPQKELEKLKENLQREVDRQTQELQTQQEELFSQNEQLMMTLDQLKNAQAHLVNSEKMASLGQLTAGIAHEINNPVSYISASIEGLQISMEDMLEIIQNYEEITPENAQQKLLEIEELKEELDYQEVLEGLTELTKNISTGAKRTAEIVKGLRHFSRLDEGALKLADIHEGIDSTLLLLNNKIKNRIQIIRQYDRNIQEIECFPGQLNQVFMNILSNAVQAIDNKGKIYINTRTEGETIEIRVRDTGKGISPNLKEKIFEPFFTTKDVGEGTGLGLSISYGIVKRHNGTIIVESELQKGTEFMISLPQKNLGLPKKHQNH